MPREAARPLAEHWNGSANVHQPRVYSRRKGAETPPPDAVYVGRGTRWGNPFKVGRDGDREKCIRAYRIMVEEHAPTVQAIRRELRGKDLVCWCAPLPCHADVLLEIANREVLT